MTEHINPCSKCGKQPYVTNMIGLWYVQCIPCEKIEVNPTKKKAVENWNTQNETALRYASGRKKQIENKKTELERKKAEKWKQSYLGRTKKRSSMQLKKS